MGCTHDCSSCGESCESKEKENLIKAPNPASTVRRVIAVMSGKGGVGKSLVTALMSVLMQRRGHQAAVMDADVTGPSVPQMFGVHEPARGGEDFILPVKSASGIQMMSMNVLLPHETDPVVWRGPIIAGAVEQFWTDVIWDDVDYMFVDMPPGTGDVPLTVFQSLPVNGVVVVASPQELVGMIVEKAVNMAAMMNKRVLGLVENMSYFVCPDCGSRHSVFGQSRIDETAERFGIGQVAKLPINPGWAASCDAGEIESIQVPELAQLADYIERGAY